MKIIVGDEVGQAKVLTTQRGHDTTLPSTPRPTTSTFFPPSRSRAITHLLSPITFRGTPGLAAVLSTGGHLRVFSPLSSPSSPEILFSHTIACAPTTPAITLCLSDEGRVLTAAVESGDVVYVDLETEEVVTARVPEGGECAVIQPTRETVEIDGADGKKSILPSALAVTRREAPGIEIYDTPVPEEKEKPAWISKAPKNSAIKLETVVLVTGLEFLGSQKQQERDMAEGTEQQTGSNGNRHPRSRNNGGQQQQHSWRFITASKDGLLRIHDTSLSRRAIWSSKIASTPIATFRIVSPLDELPSPILTTPGVAPESAALAFDLTLVASDLSGLTSLYSCTQRRQLGVFKGCEGVVKGLSVTHTEEGETLIAGVGNGRYLCVWDEERELIARAFVKTVGSCVALLDAHDEAKEEKGGKDGEEEEEDVWEGMKEVGEKDADGDEEMTGSGSGSNGEEESGKRRRREKEKGDGERRRKKKREDV